MCFIKVNQRLCPSFIFWPKCLFKLAPTRSSPPPDLVFTVIFTVSQVDLVRLALQKQAWCEGAFKDSFATRLFARSRVYLLADEAEKEPLAENASVGLGCPALT